MLKLLILICLTCAATTYSQTNTSKHDVGTSAGAGNLQAQLRLTTSISDQQYCYEGSLARLRLFIRLNFKNVGNETILLDKKSSTYDRAMISRNQRDAAARKYEEDSFFDFELDRVGTHTDAIPDESSFILLKPGESYSLETEFRPFLDDGSPDSQDDLRVGSHLLQLRVQTWRYLVPADSYRKQWRDRGYLWSKRLISMPMLFKVREKPPVSQCSYG
jgi:hypothetical protein